MNNDLATGVYVIKARYADAKGNKSTYYLVKNSVTLFNAQYYNLTLDDFHLLPTKGNKWENATWLSAAVCSDLLKQPYEEEFPNGFKVYKRCLVRKLSIKDAKKKLNTKKARKNRFLVQKISAGWTYNSNNVNEHYAEWQFTEPIKLEQAIKIAVARERLDDTKCRILMTGWRKLSKREVEQLANWR